MGIYTYLTGQQQEKYSSVTDKEMDEVLAAIREKDNGIFVSETIHTMRRWFKTIKLSTYTIYQSNGYDFRVINIGGDYSSVMAYLYGYHNGLYYQRKEEEK